MASAVVPPTRYACNLAQLLDSSFVIIDKPCGPSSHEVASWVRKMAGVSKAGHSGTLDPQVSGVLPIALGKATKLLSYMTAKDKKYVCLMRTGMPVTEQQVRSVFSLFVGQIVQTPPKESAVAKKARKRKVYYIKPLQIRSSDVLFEVHCQAGTYIRVLVADFAPYFGGAKMIELRRISVGSIREEDAHTLQELSDALWLAKEKHDESALRKILIPADEALGLPKIVIKDAAIEAVCRGAPLFVPGVAMYDKNILSGSLVAMVSQKGELVGVGVAQLSATELKDATGGVAVASKRIFMQKGLYQKGW
ncbi:MAG: RNA-guided pseudouridylation complex pseudouridine synthase subunit Cbf5 [Candidatus Micrarchaeota archaeon]|nr:RNA-guided pseudouridylation complex pseudouridine synthase subunit Cbf5 [Candidatus Micrarchaeota archaeon]